MARQNTPPMPSGKQVLHLKVDDKPVDLTIDWDHVRDLARRALFVNTTGRATFGPVALKAVKP